MNMFKPLDGQVALIPGGGSGIGRATCVALARLGAQTVIVGRTPSALDETAKEAQLVGGLPPLCLALDVARSADVERMAGQALDAFGRIDILIQAAGILRPPGGLPRTVAQLSTETWDGVLGVNLKGSYLCARAVLPAMLRQGRGDIVLLSSLAAHVGLGFDAAYAVSKCGVKGLGESLADEVRSRGVRVQVLAPGMFRTEFLRQRFNNASGQLPNYPPAERVADAIQMLVTLPRDTWLVNPVIAPLAAENGYRMAAERPNDTSDSHREKQPMSTLDTTSAGKLTGQVVIVTGGTGGIGRATCRAVHAEGAAVLVADLDPTRIDALVAELNAQSPDARAIGFALDVRDEAQQQAMAQTVLDRFGRIDALVACAGILRKPGTPPKPLVDTGEDEWDQVLDVNLKGVFLSNRAVLPAMIRQRSGCVLNISSVSGLKGRAHDGPYCASKFGIIGLSQSLADEVRSYGVKVQAIMPDAIDTPLWEQNKPVPRPSDSLPAERVADLIVFMLSQPADTVLVAPVIAPTGARRRKAPAAAPVVVPAAATMSNVMPSEVR